MRNGTVVGLVSLVGCLSVLAQATPLTLKQEDDHALPQPLSASERATLGDPLFNLLLATSADTVTLSAVQDALQPNAANRHLFVVSERIVQTAQSGTRRAVLAFDGTRRGENLAGNVMLSVSFGPTGLSDDTDIEGWGWDSRRERYNYYRLDSRGAPAKTKTWKFRGSSQDADLKTPAQRRDTCLACHIAGEPVMKELQFPWNNWHAGVGGSFTAEYLDRSSLAPNKWPAALTPPFARIGTADRLEADFLIPALKRFTTSRLNAMLKRDNGGGNPHVSASGRMTVIAGRRLLRSLFDTVGVNLISSRDTSGIHPFGSPGDFIPSLDVRIPPSFFLNTHLIAGGGLSGLNGLRIDEANRFATFAKLTQQENRALAEQFKLGINKVRGDTHFGWFVPDRAFIDNEIVDQAIRLGVVTPHFLAAALAVDLERPLFSARRADLLRFVPNQFDFMPVAMGIDPTTLQRNPATDLLTQAVLSNIARANPTAGTAADEFRELLLSVDAVSELRRRVSDYAARVETSLRGNAAQRQTELARLYALLVERRQSLLSHPVLRRLDETQGQLLFPMAGRQ